MNSHNFSIGFPRVSKDMKWDVSDSIWDDNEFDFYSNDNVITLDYYFSSSLNRTYVSLETTKFSNNSISFGCIWNNVYSASKEDATVYVGVESTTNENFLNDDDIIVSVEFTFCSDNTAMFTTTEDLSHIETTSNTNNNTDSDDITNTDSSSSGKINTSTDSDSDSNSNSNSNSISSTDSGFPTTTITTTTTDTVIVSQLKIIDSNIDKCNVTCFSDCFATIGINQTNSRFDLTLGDSTSNNDSNCDCAFGNVTVEDNDNDDSVYTGIELDMTLSDGSYINLKSYNGISNVIIATVSNIPDSSDCNLNISYCVNIGSFLNVSANNVVYISFIIRGSLSETEIEQLSGKFTIYFANLFDVDQSDVYVSIEEIVSDSETDTASTRRLLQDSEAAEEEYQVDIIVITDSQEEAESYNVSQSLDTIMDTIVNVTGDSSISVSNVTSAAVSSDSDIVQDAFGTDESDDTIVSDFIEGRLSSGEYVAVIMSLVVVFLCAVILSWFCHSYWYKKRSENQQMHFVNYNTDGNVPTTGTTNGLGIKTNTSTRNAFGEPTVLRSASATPAGSRRGSIGTATDLNFSPIDTPGTPTTSAMREDPFAVAFRAENGHEINKSMEIDINNDDNDNDIAIVGDANADSTMNITPQQQRLQHSLQGQMDKMKINISNTLSFSGTADNYQHGYRNGSPSPPPLGTVVNSFTPVSHEIPLAPPNTASTASKSRFARHRGRNRYNRDRNGQQGLNSNVQSSSAHSSLEATAVGVSVNASANNSGKKNYQFYTIDEMTIAPNVSAIGDTSNSFTNLSNGDKSKKNLNVTFAQNVFQDMNQSVMMNDSHNDYNGQYNNKNNGRPDLNLFSSNTVTSTGVTTMNTKNFSNFNVSSMYPTTVNDNSNVTISSNHHTPVPMNYSTYASANLNNVEAQMQLIQTTASQAAKQALEINYDDLELSEMLGKGEFGLVYKGVWIDEPVAVKKLNGNRLYDLFSIASATGDIDDNDNDWHIYDELSMTNDAFGVSKITGHGAQTSTEFAIANRNMSDYNQLSVNSGENKSKENDHDIGDEKKEELGTYVAQLNDVESKYLQFISHDTELTISRTATSHASAIKQKQLANAKSGCSSTDASVDEIERALKEIYSEIILACSVPYHPNLIRVFGFVVNPLCVVMDYMKGGSVDKFCYENVHKNEANWTPPDFREKLIILTKAANGLKFLHKYGLVHRDIAARNILLGKLNTYGRVDIRTAIKVTDFGMTRTLELNNKQNNNNNSNSNNSNSINFSQQTKTNFGPLKWMAPESIRDRLYSERSDVYMFGITMWEVLKGSQPYPGKNPLTIAFEVVKNELRPRIAVTANYRENGTSGMSNSGQKTYTTLNEDVYNELVQIMKSCWHQNVLLRPTFNQVHAALSKLL